MADLRKRKPPVESAVFEGRFYPGTRTASIRAVSTADGEQRTLTTMDAAHVLAAERGMFDQGFLVASSWSFDRINKRTTIELTPMIRV